MMNPSVDGEEATPPKRLGAEQAIQLALESKWEEAAALNRSLVAAHDSDVDAWNRLGKALLELGRYRDARDAYGKSLELDPVNSIAKRNLDRLSTIADADAPRRSEAVTKVASDLFIEEVGKTGLTPLQATSKEVLATLTAGDEVYLKPGDELISVENAAGEPLGTIEPKLALRLVRLMEGGSKYAAAVKSLNDNGADLIIKEIYRDPSQTRPSFPTTGGGEGVRPYIKESLIRMTDDDDDEIIDDDTDREDWDTEPDATEGPVTFTSFQNALDHEPDDDEEDEE
jgi:tetratricopeptide (TPR) repeat protein